MLKRLLICAALAFVPVGCSSLGIGTSPPTTQPPTTTQPGLIDTANKQLVAGEYAYQALLKAIQVEVRAGRLKGAKAATVQRYLRLATTALDVARTAVTTNSVSMGEALRLAVAAVGEVVIQLR